MPGTAGQLAREWSRQTATVYESNFPMFIGSASKHHTNTVLTHHPPSLNCLGVEKPCGIDNVFDTMKTNFDIDLKVGYAIMNRAKGIHISWSCHM